MAQTPSAFHFWDLIQWNWGLMLQTSEQYLNDGFMCVLTSVQFGSTIACHHTSMILHYVAGTSIWITGSVIAYIWIIGTCLSWQQWDRAMCGMPCTCVWVWALTWHPVSVNCRNHRFSGLCLIFFSKYTVLTHIHTYTIVPLTHVSTMCLCNTFLE
jgi:hypothetical protein